MKRIQLVVLLGTGLGIGIAAIAICQPTKHQSTEKSLAELASLSSPEEANIPTLIWDEGPDRNTAHPTSFIETANDNQLELPPLDDVTAEDAPLL